MGALGPTLHRLVRGTRTLHVATRPSSPPLCQLREEGGTEAQVGGTRAGCPDSELASPAALVSQAPYLPQRVTERNPSREARGLRKHVDFLRDGAVNRK